MSKEKSKNSGSNNDTVKTWRIVFHRGDWWEVTLRGKNKAEVTSALVNDAYDKTTEKCITDYERKANRIEGKRGEKVVLHGEDHRQTIFIESCEVVEDK